MIKRLLNNYSKKTVISILFLAILAILAFLTPVLFSFDPNSIDLSSLGEPEAPSLRHLFGTDDLGRDILLRCIYGARISLLVGIVSVSISITIGVLLGVITGYLGGLYDEIFMRIVDIFMAIPTLFLILTIQIILEPNIFNVMAVIGITSWMGVCRLVRAEVLSIKERTFVTALKARSLNPITILLKHILPHTLNPVIVAAMLGMGNAILVESVLSFLGLGVQPPHASWGNMLENSLAFMRDAPWMALIPGTFITLTVLALNFIGDDIRSIFDPKGRKNIC
ncbi:peptide ABC transporter permease [Candidatus Marinamargulisbacteria bacterium SCGC AG-410-N11]|nr:peptide ABC transporter permease [Candidatus Marinamargulisbacteria bacterium SCGC AG-410-N11]